MIGRRGRRRKKLLDGVKERILSFKGGSSSGELAFEEALDLS